MPEGKLEERKTQILKFLNGDCISYDQVEVLTGRLTHVSYILPQLRCYLNSMHRWKAAWRKRFARQTLPVDFREDLEYWTKTLDSFTNFRLIPATEPKEIGWVGDASTSFGVAVIIGKKWCQYRLKEGWQDRASVKRGIAWLETVAIRLGILMILELNWQKGQRFNVWTNNTTCEEALRKRKSRDKSVNEEWKAIQQLLITSDFDINPLRVISKDNKADALSRGETTDHTESDRLIFPLPVDLSTFLVST